MSTGLGSNPQYVRALFGYTIAGGANNGQMWLATFDAFTPNFNDASVGSTYYFRAETFQGRVPTVRRVILEYIDLGVCALTVGFKYNLGMGEDQAPATYTTNYATSIGTAGATGQILTQFVSVQVTGFNPQLFISRAANAGPMALVSATISGTVEEISL